MPRFRLRSLLIAVAILAAMVAVGTNRWRREADRWRHEADRLTALHIMGEDHLGKARDAVAQGDWATGKVILVRLLARIEGEPRLADLRARAEELLARAERGLAEQRMPSGPRAPGRN